MSSIATLTVEQLRSARAALRWSINDLSEKAGVSIRTIKMVEGTGGEPKCKPKTLDKLRVALESAGIEFIGTPNDAPGIRIHGGGSNGCLVLDT
jgi:transcriptional regulator with XRE-family HTH domain